MISGMGTPDILGTEGTFTILTTNPALLKSKRGIRIKLPKKSSTIQTFLQGPKHQTLKDIQTSTTPITIIKSKKIYHSARWCDKYCLQLNFIKIERI